MSFFRKKIICLCMIVGLVIFMMGCADAQEKSRGQEIQAVEPEFLTQNQSYAYIELKNEGTLLLLVTDGTYGYHGLEAGFYSSVYCQDKNGSWKELGRVVSSGTAYPLRVDDKGIYAAGGHSVIYYGVDKEGMELVQKECASEEFDEEGNVTYTYVMDGGQEQLAQDGSYFHALFEKYEEAELVNFRKNVAYMEKAEEAAPVQKEGNTQLETRLEEQKGGKLMEDEEAVYLCSTDRICKISKSDHSYEVLWEKPDTDAGMDLYRGGNALLLENRIYFLEEAYYDNQSRQRIVSIQTDGTWYRVETEFVNSSYWSGSMHYAEGIVYLTADKEMYAYEWKEDGTLALFDSEEQGLYVDISEGYEAVRYCSGGSRYLSMWESLQYYDYLLVMNESGEIVRYMVDSGSETAILPEGKLASLNKSWLLMQCFDKEQRGDFSLYLVDAESLEKRFLVSGDVDTDVRDMDEEYVYLQRLEADEYIYEKISIESGERYEIFRQKKWAGMGYYGPGVMESVVFNGYVYYVDVIDYKLYLMRRNLENPAEAERLGEAFYDNGIGDVGTVVAYDEEIHSEIIPEVTLVSLYLERLVVKDTFPGAEKINEALLVYEQEIVGSMGERFDIQWLEEQAAQDGDCFFNTISSGINGISYYDGKVFSFCQDEYYYTGGAHGMSYWIGWTFDLQTGELLNLQDILANSEEELKEIVTGYFSEYIDQEPGAFWEDAKEVVWERTGYDCDFYLTQEGIVFYYGPYELACYAAGFQSVTIPYEEFSLKLPVGAVSSDRPEV